MTSTRRDGRIGALSMIKDDIDQFRLEPAMQGKVRDHYDYLQQLAADRSNHSRTNVYCGMPFLALYAWGWRLDN